MPSSPPKARCWCWPVQEPAKTRVLATRIAHILSQRLAWPSEILSVTFTNKAAREMQDRIATLAGASVEGMPWLGTFHRSPKCPHR